MPKRTERKSECKSTPRYKENVMKGTAPGRKETVSQNDDSNSWC